MYKTSIGDFDGNSWESFCQQCFRLKYEDEGYQFVPAIGGDYGIEGFTRTGLVFQCYCPDNNSDSNTLYEAQRDKITKDLGKLSLYEKQLKKYLADIRIKKWFFVTPEYSKKELVKHCMNKAEEMRKLSLSILEPEFDVLILDINSFVKEIPIVLDYLNKSVDISVKGVAEDAQLLWINTEISLVSNANKKNRMLINEKATNSDQKVDTLTSLIIKDKLDGDIIVDKWKDLYPADYEKFLRVVDLVEREVIRTCINPTSDTMGRYDGFKDLVYDKLKITFTNLSEPTLLSLRNKVIADWILNCPISFE